MTKVKEKKRKSLLKNFYPKYTFEKVEDIPYELISRDGIRLILMDMDNTLIDSKGKFSKELKNALQKSEDNLKKISVSFLPFENNSVESMFKMTENQIQNKIPPLSDYDGPLYLRKSEAEVKLEEKTEK